MTEEFLHELASHFEKKIIPADEYLFQKHSNNLNLWVVEDGVIEEIPNKEAFSKPLSEYNKTKSNNMIGWINFLTGEFYQSWGISKCFSIVYELDKHTFFDVIKNFKKDFYHVS